MLLYTTSSFLPTPRYPDTPIHEPVPYGCDSPPCPLSPILLFISVMKGQSTYCINHSNTRTKRKCFQCLSHICPSCQRKALGHTFCSFKCQASCWMADRAATLKRYALLVSLRYRRVERSVGKITGGGFARLLTISLLLVILYQSGFLVKTAREFPGAPGTGQSVPAFPSAELVHEGEWITVAGSAPGFGVAVLLTDGRERDVSTVREGYFSFTFQAEKTVRSVQIQVYGDQLPTMYTRALPIPDSSLADLPARPEEQDSAQKPAVNSQPGKKPEAPVKMASKPDSPPAVVSDTTVTDTTVPDTTAMLAPEVSPKTPTAKPETRTAIVPKLSSPSTWKPGEDMVRGRSGSRMVAVTFDGGSYSNGADKILNVLAKRNLKATFFLTGDFMNDYPEVTRKIAREGHEVGNHTYSHLHLTTFEKNFRQDTLPGINQKVLLAELAKNEALFEKLSGKKMVKLWRAPYGEQNETIRNWASTKGYQHVSWTYDPKTRKSLDGLDWVSDQDSALYLTSEEIVNKIISFDSQTEMGLAGGIVLLHLGSERKDDPFYPRLGQLIDKLREKGYEVGSVSSLLAKGG